MEATSSFEALLQCIYQSTQLLESSTWLLESQTFFLHKSQGVLTRRATIIKFYSTNLEQMMQLPVSVCCRRRFSAYCVALVCSVCLLMLIVSHRLVNSAALDRAPFLDFSRTFQVSTG
jgi:hypothetical protein